MAMRYAPARFWEDHSRKERTGFRLLSFWLQAPHFSVLLYLLFPNISVHAELGPYFSEVDGTKAATAGRLVEMDSSV